MALARRPQLLLLTRRVARQARAFLERAPPAPPGEPPVAVDVTYERRILADAEAHGAAGSSAAGDALLARVQAFAEAAERHARAGLSAEDVRLAVAMVGDSGKARTAAKHAGGPCADVRAASQVAEFAGNIAKLRGMGFPPEVVCGALLQCDNDLERAASRCLSG